jgi:large subunit ribosomal protein L22
MTGPKTNEGATKVGERTGTRAVVRYVRVSATKAREVLDLIRGLDAKDADDVLRFAERDVAIIVRKCLASAVANAQANDGQDPDELYVSACFADEGPTLKRFRPRARGRATRVRKRTCHITIIVSRLSDADLERRRAREASRPQAGRRTGRGGAAAAAASRRERVARSRQAAAAGTSGEELDEEPETTDAAEDTEVDATEPDETVDAHPAEADEAEAEGTAEPDDAADAHPAEADEAEAEGTAEPDDAADAHPAEADEAEAEDTAKKDDA